MTAGWPEALRGRPVCPHRQLPIPFIAEIGPDGTGEFTILDQHQAMACISGRLCAMCGDRMDGEVALIGDVASLEPGSFFIEPPVHERCGELATGGLCPYLSRERVPRRPVPGDVALVGTTAAELAGVGRGTAKRPVIMAIATGYEPGWVPSVTGSPVLAYRPLGVLRVRHYTYSGGRLTGVVREFRQPGQVAVIRSQPRRTTRAGRRRR
jgi:hypothetical protein